MKKGFTIIEVSLVLAIAGLIFLMVFVALPALRSSQRDSARREDMISLIDTIKKYQTNNRGSLPGNASNGVITWESANSTGEKGSGWVGFYFDYLGKDFIDPMGENYKLNVVDCDASNVGDPCNNKDIQKLNDISFSDNDYTITVVRQSKCAGESAESTSNPRKISVLYKLEGAGVYCNNI